MLDCFLDKREKWKKRTSKKACSLFFCQRSILLLEFERMRGLESFKVWHTVFLKAPYLNYGFRIRDRIEFWHVFWNYTILRTGHKNSDHDFWTKAETTTERYSIEKRSTFLNLISLKFNRLFDLFLQAPLSIIDESARIELKKCVEMVFWTHQQPLIRVAHRQLQQLLIHPQPQLEIYQHWLSRKTKPITMRIYVL